MFKSKNKGKSKGGLTVVGANMNIEGNLDTEASVRVDGRVTGTEHRVGNLNIGAAGALIGNVQTSDAVIAGTVRGKMQATGRVDVLRGAIIQGEIRAKAMVMHEGARFQGTVAIGEEIPAEESKKEISGIAIVS